MSEIEAKMIERLRAVLSIHGGHSMTNGEGHELWSTKAPVNVTALARHAIHEYERAALSQSSAMEKEHYATSRADGFGYRSCSCGAYVKDGDLCKPSVGVEELANLLEATYCEMDALCGGRIYFDTYAQAILAKYNVTARGYL